MKKLLNLKTQNTKVVPYNIWNSQLRLAKNQSCESIFWTDLVYSVVYSLVYSAVYLSQLLRDVQGAALDSLIVHLDW